MRSRLTFTFAAAAAISALIPAVASAATISSSTATPLADNFTDDAECSLREMVQIANTDNGAVENACTVDESVTVLGNDTINLGTGLYQLGIPLGADTIATGDLEVEDTVNADDGTLTITGLGRANTLIDGGDLDRVFEAGFGDFRLEELTVQDGQVINTNGGGILSSASVELEGVVVRDNATVASGAGGGILMSGMGTLTLSNSIVETNVASGTGGGIELRQSASLTTQGGAVIGGDTPGEGNTAGSQGGGINVSQGAGGGADVDLNAGASVQNNNAVALGGGIAHTISTAGSDLTIDAASVSNNDVGGVGTASGGGIHHVGNDPTQVFSVSDGSEITGNTASGDEATGAGINAVRNNGTLNISQSSVSANATTVNDNANNGNFEGGGGITLTGSTLTTLTDSTVSSNTVTVQDLEDVAVGGGIRDDGTLTIDSSTLTNNSVAGGFDTDVNSTPRGGALYAASPLGPTNVINSAISGNTAVAGTGGSLGGGILGFTATQPLFVVHTTFTGNSAAFGDAMNVGGGSFGPNLTLRGSLFDEDGNFACHPGGLLDDSDAYNVDAGTTCVGSAVDTDLRNATTMLDPGLTPNGGPTSTHALLAGSPAIDFVPNTAPDCRDLTGGALTVDQRGAGFARPEGTACDAGSFEAQDTDNDGVVDVNDPCPAQAGSGGNGCPVAATSTTTPTESPECEPLRQKIKKLSRKIKRAEDPDQKAKLKKKRRNARKQLTALGCAS